MGTYRLILAASVAVFHFGGGSLLSGRAVVFSFFCLSGYLMTRVIDRVYWKHRTGTPAFYLNRALRIFPVYIFYILLTYALTMSRGATAFTLPDERVPYTVLSGSLTQFSLLQFWRDLTLELNFTLTSLLNVSSPSAVPQAWSLAVEWQFYLVAPLVVLAIKPRWAGPALLLISSAYVASTVLTGLDFDNYRYKSILGSFYIFVVGALLFRFEKNIPTIPWVLPTFAVSLLVWLYLIFGAFGGEFAEWTFYAVLPLQIFLTYLAVRLPRMPERLRTFDRICGDFSYPVFVNHFAAAFILLWVAEFLRANFGVAEAFGHPNRLTFGAWIVAASLALAVATHFLVERPIDRLRTLVRGQEAPGG